MTTIVNNPSPAENKAGGIMGMVFGLIVLIVMAYLFFVYGLPAIQNMKLGNPQITIPAKIDVTVNQPK